MITNKKLLQAVVAAIALLPVSLAAQSETDAIRYSRTELGGSARYSAMAGAMGAVGVDYSSLRQNPAGSALNRRDLVISFTANYNQDSWDATWKGNRNNQKGGGLSFEELSLMWKFPSLDDNITYAFGVQRECDFNRKVDISAASPGASLADYVSAMINNMQRKGNLIPHKNLSNKNFQNSSTPWIGILGYEGGWIDSNDPAGGLYFPRYVYDGKIELPQSAEIQLQESGEKWRYDANFSFDIDDNLFLGIGVDFHTLVYQAKSNYTEFYLQDEKDKKKDYLGLDGLVKATGSGVGFNFGVIYAPIPELRLGAAYYSPTWWSMRREYVATGSSRYGGDRAQTNSKGEIVKTLSIETPQGMSAYALRTPWRFTASLASILGQRAILSVDYEYRNLGSNRFGDEEDASDASYIGDNQAIKEDFGHEHTLRIGAEFRVTNRFSLRAGGMLRNQPVKNSRINDYTKGQEQEVYVAGTTPHYVLPDKSSALTCGFGYRLSPNWSLDVAFLWQQYRSHLITFPFINDEGPLLDPKVGASTQAEPRPTQLPIDLNRHKFSSSVTLLYRF